MRVLSALLCWSLLLLQSGHGNTQGTGADNTLVIVTGATGRLGTSLLHCLCSDHSRQYSGIYGSYRSLDRAKQTLAGFSRTSNAPTTTLNRRPQFFPLEDITFPSLMSLLKESDRITQILPGLGRCSAAEHMILINNAGVCLPGSDKEILKQSIALNTLLPLILAKEMEKFAVNNQEKRVTVVNISSGDGELVYLHSDIAQRIASIETLAGLVEYTSSELLDSYDSRKENAFGPTPCYSISKALLNKLTQLYHRRTEDNKLKNMRTLACCPGNFISPMTDESELSTAIPVEDAAKQVLKVALDYDGFPGGRFYRFGEDIPW